MRVLDDVKDRAVQRAATARSFIVSALLFLPAALFTALEHPRWTRRNARARSPRSCCLWR
jgi:hypothetical protein